jgi:uncharacterized membrane protein YphA (DoxX/SURF4 family)
MEELKWVGRIMLALYMCIGAYNNAVGFAPTVEQMRKLHLPLPTVVLPLVIVFEVVASAALFVPRAAMYSALALALFCVVAPTLFHPFWTMPDNFERFLHKNLFFANITIAGVFLMLAASSP